MQEIGPLRKLILNTVEDLVSSFLYYDRKEDEELPVGKIEEAIKNNEITEAEISKHFMLCLYNSLKLKH